MKSLSAISFIITFLLLVSSCTADKKSAQKQQLDQVCDEFARIDHTVKEPALNASLKADYLDKNLKDEQIKNVFTALAGVDPSVKYSTLIRGLEELGIKGWSCDALK